MINENTLRISPQRKRRDVNTLHWLAWTLDGPLCHSFKIFQCFNLIITFQLFSVSLRFVIHVIRFWKILSLYFIIIKRFIRNITSPPNIETLLELYFQSKKATYLNYFPIKKNINYRLFWNWYISYFHTNVKTISVVQTKRVFTVKNLFHQKIIITWRISYK